MLNVTIIIKDNLHHYFDYLEEACTTAIVIATAIVNLMDIENSRQLITILDLVFH